MTGLPAEHPLLAAATPQHFLATHLQAHQARHEGGADTSAHAWSGEDVVLDDRGHFVRAAHARILGTGGGTSQMAARWLVGWLAGSVADAVGFVLGTGGAGVLAGTAPLRWRLHPDGWVDRVCLDGRAVLVPPGHPWAGQPGVEVVRDEDELVTRTVGSLVLAVRPVVDAVRGVARVGARSLWAEVADALALSPTLQPHLPVREDVVRRLRAAVTAPGAPWRVSPTLRTASAPWGPVYLGQKGGCCLAHQRPGPASDAEPDDARFCTTCSLRDPQGCADRQLRWLGQQVAPAAPSD